MPKPSRKCPEPLQEAYSALQTQEDRARQDGQSDRAGAYNAALWHFRKYESRRGRARISAIAAGLQDQIERFQESTADGWDRTVDIAAYTHALILIRKTGLLDD